MTDKFNMEVNKTFGSVKTYRRRRENRKSRTMRHNQLGAAVLKLRVAYYAPPNQCFGIYRDNRFVSRYIFKCRALFLTVQACRSTIFRIMPEAANCIGSIKSSYVKPDFSQIFHSRNASNPFPTCQ